MNSPPSSKKKWGKLAPLALLLLSALLFLFLLGRESLYDWDEAWYGQVAKEILKSGDWVGLTWRGLPFFDKPPLAIWAIAGSFRLFGMTEWAARLPSALCSIGTVLLVYWLGKLVFGKQRPALFSALALLTTLPFVKAGRMAMLDGPLTFAFTLGVAGFLAAKKDRRWGLLVGVSLGLVWMIKGPLAILLLCVLAAFALLDKTESFRKPILGSPWFWGGILLSLCCSMPWYILQGRHWGSAFWQGHFGFHMLTRATRTLDGHQGPPWFYLGHIASLDHPWFLTLLLGLPILWAKRAERAVKLGLVWSLVVLGAFSLAATKLPWYAVPAYPGLALLSGAVLEEAAEQGSKALGWAWSVFGGLLLLASIGLLFSHGEYSLAALLLGTGLLSGGVLLFSRLKYLAPYLVTLGTYLAFLALIHTSLHWEARFEPDLRPFAKAARSLPRGQKIFLQSPGIRPSLIYYLDREESTVRPEELASRWEQVPHASLLLYERDRKRWGTIIPELSGAIAAAETPEAVLLIK